MARPVTKEIKFRDGFYIEVRQKGAQKGSRIRRDTYEQIQLAMKEYKKAYDVHYIGEIKNGKVK